jgi:hypothetical protein
MRVAGFNVFPHGKRLYHRGSENIDAGQSANKTFAKTPHEVGL